MPEDRDEKTEDQEPEPELEERLEEPEPDEEPERPTDFALGAWMNRMEERQNGHEAELASLRESLQSAVASLPEAVGDAVQSALEALQEDSHGEDDGETPLEVNPTLRWWEKGLLGRK